MALPQPQPLLHHAGLQGARSFGPCKTATSGDGKSSSALPNETARAIDHPTAAEGVFRPLPADPSGRMLAPKHINPGFEGHQQIIFTEPIDKGFRPQVLLLVFLKKVQSLLQQR